MRAVAGYMIHSRASLKVGCSVDGSRVVVLVEGTLEGSSLGAGSGARSLLARTGADSSATHQVIIFLVVLVGALLLNAPDNDGQNTDDDGTTDADNDTNDNLLV